MSDAVERFFATRAKPGAVVPESLLADLRAVSVVAVVVAAIFVGGTRLFPTDRPTGRVVSGTERRRAEIREYLSTIGERYVEDERVADQRVAFVLPERDVVITFDARVYFRLLKSDVVPILVEHEMPIAHLADRLPFRTPTVTGRESDAVTAAFAVLGLPPTAGPGEVRAAYRREIKRVHPDHGGDPDAFQRVREAYTIACDAATRGRRPRRRRPPHEADS